MEFTDWRVNKKWGKPNTKTFASKQLAYKHMRQLNKEYKKWKETQKGKSQMAT